MTQPSPEISHGSKLANAQVAAQALEQRQEAERFAYLLLRKLLPHVKDDGSDPALTGLLAEIVEVVEEREAANEAFIRTALLPRGRTVGR